MLGATPATRPNLDAIVVSISRKHGIDPNLTRAIIQQESGWNIFARRYEPGVKDTSIGLMQLLVKTAQWRLNQPDLTPQELFKPHVNIEAGVNYLAYLKGRYSKLEDYISAYNGGHPLHSSKGGYVNQKYVDNVKRHMESFRFGSPITAGLLDFGSDTGKTITVGAVILGALALIFGIIG